MISSDFLAALADSLAPGADVKLPAASMVGCDHALAQSMLNSSNLQAIIIAIAAQADGAAAFIACDPRSRSTFLEIAQREQPESFAGLVTATLTHYYAQPQVLAALGWSARPPQPEGHVLPPFDDGLLTSVRARGPIWRQC